MKKNTTVPTISSNEITAAVSLAFSIADLKNIKSTYLVDLVEKGYSVEDITKASKEFDAMAEQAKEEAESKARMEAEEKAMKEAEERINKLNTSDRMMIRIIDTIKNFDSDNTTADDIKNMLLENSSTIKLAGFIGGKLADEKAMKVITYVYESIKNEKELIRFSSTFVRVVEELCKK